MYAVQTVVIFLKSVNRNLDEVLVRYCEAPFQRLYRVWRERTGAFPEVQGSSEVIPIFFHSILVTVRFSPTLPKKGTPRYTTLGVCSGLSLEEPWPLYAEVLLPKGV
jgi:hypothetical protein